MKPDIRAARKQAYQAGSYEQRIDYRVPCEPPLKQEDQAWADQLIRSREG